MNWWLVAGSLAAVLLLAGIARLLGLGGVTSLTCEEAVALADALVPGFEGRVAIVSTDGHRAAVAAGAGDLVLIEPLGARFRARRFTAARVATAPDERGITLALTPLDMFHLPLNDVESARAFARTLG